MQVVTWADVKKEVLSERISRRAEVPAPSESLAESREPVAV